MEVLKALLTFASIWTTLPSLMGFSNEILSTEAVTTGALQCFPADSAAAISIQYISRPPIRLPKTFVSLGRTSSVMMIWDSCAVFAFGFIQSGLPANIGLYRDGFAPLQEAVIHIGAKTGSIGHFEDIAFESHSAGHGV